MTLRAKTFRLLERCIADGIERGWNRAHKHTSAPSPVTLKSDIERSILEEIDEWFHFEAEREP